MTAKALTSDEIVALAPTLAAIHRDAFTASGERGWSTDEIAALAARSTCVVFAGPAGFVAADVIGDEAEILTLAVARKEQGIGVGAKLLEQSMCYFAESGVTKCHLEVASDNFIAVALYHRAGFRPIGLRRDYFTRKNSKVDAILMKKLFTAS